MKRGSAHLYFGHIRDGRVQLRTADGSIAPSPIPKGSRLVISRSDCNLLCLEMRRTSRRRVERRVKRELPQRYPGSLADVALDIVVQPINKKLAVLVVLMREEHLVLYETAAGNAALTLASRLVASVRRPPREDAYATEQILIRDGSVREVATFNRKAIVASYLLPSGSDLPHGVTREIKITDLAGGPETIASTAPPPPKAPFLQPVRPSELFDRHRGVPRWMRSTFVAPLFLVLALPILVAGNLAAVWLLADRAEGVEALRTEVTRLATVTRASAEKAQRSREIVAQLERLAEKRARDVYALLVELSLALGGGATVQQFMLISNAAEITILSSDPVETLRLIADLPSVSSAEMVAAGQEQPGGHAAVTARVVYK